MSTVQHVAAYDASVAASQTNLSVNAIQDGILTILNNHFVVPSSAKIQWVFAGGTNLNRIRLNTPKFRYIGLPSLVPINKTFLAPSPFNVYDGRDYPMVVDPVDEIAMESSTDASGAARNVIVVCFAFGQIAITPGPLYRLRATAAIAGAANAWTSGSMTFDQTLPSGHYSICGMDCVDAGSVAARLIIPGTTWRPGCICRVAPEKIKNPIFAPGYNGCIGDFDSINVPNLEVLGDGTAAAQEVFLDVMRTGPISQGQQATGITA
jgi:hypothetical protein